MPDCNLCPTLFELAHRAPNTWVRIGLFHGLNQQHDACQVQVIRDTETITGTGETWQQAMADLQSRMKAERLNDPSEPRPEGDHADRDRMWRSESDKLKR